MRAIVKAIEILSSQGFERIGNFLGGEILGLERRVGHDYVRFFAPQIIFTGSGRNLVGIIGSMEVSALAEWEKIDRLSKYFVISVHSANFEDLRDPPSFGIREDEDVSWCKRIAAIADRFPTERGELKRLLAEKGAVSGLTLDRFDA